MRYLFQLFSPLIAKRVMWRKLAFNGKWKDIFSHFYFLLNYIKNIIFLCCVIKWMIIVWDFCSYLFAQLFVTKSFFLLLQNYSTLFPSQFKAVKNLISCGKLNRNICSIELVSFDQLFPRLFIRLDISWSQIHQTFGRLTLPCNALTRVQTSFLFIQQFCRWVFYTCQRVGSLIHLFLPIITK